MTASRIVASLRATAVVLLAASAAPSQASAQTDPRLVAAVRNAQEGQGDSARKVVRQLLATTDPADTLYPQVLYTAAIIANEAGEMRRQLQRVAVEFPTSSWVDDALLRLVQLDYATRNLDGAARNLERLAVDFPASPLMPQAAYWAGRTYFDLKKDADACRWLADGMAHSQSDVETQMQLGYLYQRCDTTPPAVAAGPDSAAPPPDSVQVPMPAPTPAPVPAPEPATPQFRVQIAAVGTPGAADAIAQKAKALGYTTVTVQEGSLYKVRAGEFPTRAEAQQAAGALKAKLGGSPFVVAGQ